MKHFSLTSLRAQAVLWTLLPLTLIFLIVASVGVYAFSEIVSRLVYDRDRELAQISAARLNENMENYAETLQALAEHDFMQSDNFGSQKSILQAAIERGSLAVFDGGVGLFDATGNLEIGAMTVQVDVDAYQMALVNLPDRSFADEPFFEIPRLTGEPYFSDIIGNVDEPRIIVSAPVHNERGQFVGVLAGSFLIENETLGNEIRKLGVGTAYLVDSHGRVIWHDKPRFIGRDFSERDPVRALLDPDIPSTVYRGVNIEGKAVVFGTAPVSTPGWGLVIQEEWDVVIGPIRNFQWIMVGTLSIGLTLVIVIISSGTSRLNETIQELVRQTQRLSAGEFVGQVSGGHTDEMRALADAFNEMADRVARYRAALQSYVGAITQSQEEERKRIARDLHDDTIQSLIALGRRLELLGQTLENPMDAAKQLYQLEQMLAQVVAEVRQFSRDLRPVVLEDLGLEAAIRQMLREMERHEGVETAFAIEGEIPLGGLDDELEVTLYRIGQEALNNIRKHAQATYVEVTLYYEPSTVRLSVQDNGVGFSLAGTDELAHRGSFGLMGIQERANLFGGKLEIHAAPGEGTCVEIALPLTVAPEWVLEELRTVATVH
ncbi:MAG: histidine kinase [Chloroflexota bacterium]|nr:histidine kinase [Chloroflexota bacterium]